MIRQFSVPEDQWRGQSPSALAMVFGTLAEDAETSRDWRGTVVVTFDDVQEDSAFESPAVLAFVRSTFAATPHALYYLHPTGQGGGMWAWLTAHADALPIANDDGGLQVPMDTALAVRAEAMLLDVARFSVRMGDDWYAVLDPHLDTIRAYAPGLWRLLPRDGGSPISIDRRIRQALVTT